MFYLINFSASVNFNEWHFDSGLVITKTLMTGSDGDLLFRYKYMDSLQESFFCSLTQTVSAQTVYEVNMTDSQMAGLKLQTCTLRIRVDPMDTLWRRKWVTFLGTWKKQDSCSVCCHREPLIAKLQSTKSPKWKRWIRDLKTGLLDILYSVKINSILYVCIQIYS